AGGAGSGHRSSSTRVQAAGREPLGVATRRASDSGFLYRSPRGPLPRDPEPAAEGHAGLLSRGPPPARLALRPLPRRRARLRLRGGRRAGRRARRALHAQGGRGDRPAALPLRAARPRLRAPARAHPVAGEDGARAAGRAAAAAALVRDPAVLALRADATRPPPRAPPVEHGRPGPAA